MWNRLHTAGADAPWARRLVSLFAAVFLSSYVLASAQPTQPDNDVPLTLAPQQRPITAQERRKWFVEGALAPKALGTGLVMGAWHTAVDSPEEWQGSSGFTKRVLTYDADNGISKGIEASLGLLWGEDPRPVRSRRDDLGGRLGFAIKTVVLAPRSDGHLGPAWGRYAGTGRQQCRAERLAAIEVDDSQGNGAANCCRPGRPTRHEYVAGVRSRSASSLHARTGREDVCLRYASLVHPGPVGCRRSGITRVTTSVPSQRPHQGADRAAPAVQQPREYRLRAKRHGSGLARQLMFRRPALGVAEQHGPRREAARKHPHSLAGGIANVVTTAGAISSRVCGMPSFLSEVIL